MSKGLRENLLDRHVFFSLRFFSDHGIFITNIIPGGIAAQEGRLKIGDRLLAVQSEVKN